MQKSSFELQNSSFLQQNHQNDPSDEPLVELASSCLYINHAALAKNLAFFNRKSSHFIHKSPPHQQASPYLHARVAQMRKAAGIIGGMTPGYLHQKKSQIQSQKQAQSGGFQTNNGGFHAQSGGFQTENGGFHAQSGGFQTKNGGFHAQSGGFQTENGGFHALSGASIRAGSGAWSQSTSAVYGEIIMIQPNLSFFEKLKIVISSINPSLTDAAAAAIRPIRQAIIASSPTAARGLLLDRLIKFHHC